MELSFREILALCFKMRLKIASFLTDKAMELAGDSNFRGARCLLEASETILKEVESDLGL